MVECALVHMTMHCREFCVMCCVASRIVCNSVENIDGRTRCWMFCELLVSAQTTTSAFLHPSVYRNCVSWWCSSNSVK